MMNELPQIGNFKLKLFLKYAILIACFWISDPFESKATHLMGSDLTYECISPNKYLIRLKLFRDCNGINPNFSYAVNYSSASCGVNSSINVTRVGNAKDITPLCPNESSECSGGSSPYGVEEWVYEGTLNLPAGCGDDWLISWERCCRNNAITTLNNSGNNTFYVSTTIDNTLSPCNNSPEFLTSPTPFTCVNNPFSYNHGVDDVDGDSLVFSIGPCLQDQYTLVNYISGLSPTTPLSTSVPVSINSFTGDITFTPDMVQVGVICVLVEEYRDGVKIGEVVRDMQITVLGCSNTPPQATGVDSTNVYYIDVCEREQFCFDIYTLDSNGDDVDISWNQGIPEASFQIDTSTFPPSAKFCWSPDSTDVGSHYFTVRLEDDHCPISGTNIFSYVINVSNNNHPKIEVGADKSICLGDTVGLVLKGLTPDVDSIKWSDGYSVWNTDKVVKPKSDKNYIAIAYYNDGCQQIDRKSIKVKQVPYLVAFPFNSYICPGSSVQLNAMTNGTSTLNWTPSAGISCINCNNPVANPLSSTVYQVEATDTNGCGSRVAELNVSNDPPLDIPTCNVVYATPSGTGGGSQNDPTNLYDAIRQAQCNNTTIKLSAGIYVIDTPITNISSFTTVEGGYNPTTWKKSSTAGATTLLRTSNNVEDTSSAPRLVAIYMSSASQFKFQDLTIRVQDAISTNGLGVSSYGVHLSNCSNYDFTRVQIIAGNATDGKDGNPGINGTAGEDGEDGTTSLIISGPVPGRGGNGGGILGLNGGSGGSPGIPPEDGAAPLLPMFGGGGGSGGKNDNAGNPGGDGGAGGGYTGPQLPAGIGGASGSNDGTDGVDGVDGIDGVDGAQGASGIRMGGIFIPFKAGDGQDGTGGNGGSGGGAGSFTLLETENSGGGGGGGGGAGSGGTGGYGGGSSYGVFIYQNGPGGSFRQCNIQAGDLGSGGNGTDGGIGAPGGAGGSGATAGSGGKGGDGGDGGKGGKGGEGGDGKSGEAINLIVESGSPLNTLDINFNLLGQPVITAENISCTNTGLNFTSSVSGNWTFPVDANPASVIGSAVNTEFDSIGRKTIMFNNGSAYEYVDFVNIAINSNSIIPDIISTATYLGGDSFLVCNGGTATFQGIAASGDTFHWDFHGAVTPSVYRGDTYQNLLNIPFNVTGVFPVTFRAFNECCGWTPRDTVYLIVDSRPNLSYTGDLDICYGDSTLIKLSGATKYEWSPFVGLSNNSGDSAYIFTQMNRTYTIIGRSAYGYCTDNLILNVVVNDFTVSMASTSSDCNNNGTATANIIGTGPFAYIWNDGQTTKTATGLGPGLYEVTITQTSTSCQKTGTVIVAPDSAVEIVVLSSTGPSCFGFSDGYAVLDIIGGQAPYTVNWSNGTTALYDSSLANGTYSIIAIDQNGCVDSISLDISQPDSMYIDTFDIQYTTCPERTDGEIEVFIDGGTGPFQYLWDDTNNQDSLHAVNLSVGNYNVVATDQNGCTASASYYIGSPSALNLTSSVTDVACFGDSSGAISLNVTGGTGSYAFIWSNGANSPGISQLSAGSYAVTVADDNLCTDSLLNITVSQATQMNISSAVTNVSCFGGNNGSIDITVTGASPPYSFNWSNSSVNEDISNLYSNLYDLVVTDSSGCTDSISIWVGEPSDLTIDTVLVSDVRCFGLNNGSIDVEITNGLPPYSFNWSSGQLSEDINNLDSGLYTLSVTDSNGCLDTMQIVILEPAFLQADTASVINIQCNGLATGEIDLIISGGNFPYSYLWSDGSADQDIDSLTAGLYKVTVTDNKGCTDSMSIQLTEAALLEVDTLSKINVSCYGTNTGSADIVTSGGITPYSYLWSDGALVEDRANLYAAVYKLTVTDAKGCLDSISINISEPSQLVVDTIAKSNVSCFGGSNGSIDIAVSGGKEAYSFNWSDGQTTEDLTGLNQGNYSLTVNDQNGCQDSITIEITQSSLLQIDTQGISLVTCNGLANGSIDISVTGGKSPYSYSWSNSDTTEDIDSLLAGIYKVTVTDANLCTKKMTINVSDPSAVSVDTSLVLHPLCNGQNTGFIDISSWGGTSPYSYSWSNLENIEDIDSLSAGLYSVTVTDFNGCQVNLSVQIEEPQILTIDTLSLKDLDCFSDNSGSADISVTGGTLPYQYFWNDGVTTEDRSTVSAGIYTLTVQDLNGCTDSISFTITEPPLLVLDTLNMNNVSCNGGTDGSISTAVSGGVLPYSYLWSDGDTNPNRNNVQSGSYIVTITDSKGCSDSLIFILTEPSALLLDTLVIDHVNCFGGSDGQIDISASGSNGSYVFLWSDGNSNEDRSNIAAALYSVTATDTLGCSDSISILINEPSILVLDTVSVDNVNCFGAGNGQITTSTSGGNPPYSYSWIGDTTTSNQGSDLGPGLYTIIASDSKGCSDSISVSISEPGELTIDTNSLTNPLCVGQPTGSVDINVSGGIMPYGFFWSNGSTTEDNSGLPDGVHSVIVNDANGCIATLTIELYDPIAVQLSLNSSNDVSCFGGSDGNIDVSVSGGNPPYSYIWNDGSTNEDRSNLNAGTYTVSVYDNYGCTDVMNINISQSAEISIDTLSSTLVHCTGGSDATVDVEVSGGMAPYTFLWSDSSVSEDRNDLSVGIYSVVVTDLLGCTDTMILGITQIDSIKIKESGIQIPSCFGTSDASIDIVVTGGTGPYTYEWSDSSTSEDPNGLSFGAYSVTVTDMDGCRDSLQDIFVIQPSSIILSIDSMRDPVCYGEANGIVYASALGGTAPYSFVWSNGNTSYVNAGITNGAYGVTVTDANGCSMEDSVYINDPAPLDITANVTNARCFGENSAEIDASVSGGVPPYSYAWSNGMVTEDISNLFVGLYVLTVTDNNNCVVTEPFLANQPLPLFLFFDSLDRVICHDDTSGALEVKPVGGEPWYTYLWSTGSTDSVIFNLPPGNYSVTVTDQKGCSKSNSASLNNPPEFKVSTSSDSVDCYGDLSGIIELFPSGGVSGYSYNWSNGMDSSAYSELPGGSYIITVTDYLGCADTLNIILEEPSEMVVSYLPENVSCYGGKNGSIELSVSGGIPWYQYSWPDGSTGSIKDSLAAGIYEISVTDANNCEQIAYIELTEPLPFEIIDQVKDIKCYGESNGSISIQVFGGMPAYSLNWSNGDSGKIIESLPPGDYGVDITDANGCKEIRNYSISEPDEIILNTVKYNPSCNEVSNGYAKVAPIGGILPYYYYWSDGSTTAYIKDVYEGSYTIVVTDANGCQVSDTIIVNPPPPISAEITPADIEIGLGESIELSIIHNLGSDSVGYFWSPANGLSCTDCQNPTATPFNSIVYTVVVQDLRAGNVTCEIERILEIIVDENVNLFAPNAFTPNGDGSNDYFTIHGENISQINLSIYNRLGEKIHGSAGLQGWDGTFKGEMANPGVYVYTADITFIHGKKKSLKGSFTLIR